MGESWVAGAIENLCRTGKGHQNENKGRWPRVATGMASWKPQATSHRRSERSSSTRRVRDGDVTAVVTPNLWASLCILFGFPSFLGPMPGPRRDARPFRPRAGLCNSPLTPSALALLPSSSPPTQELPRVRPSTLLAWYGWQIQPRQQGIAVA